MKKYSLLIIAFVISAGALAQNQIPKTISLRTTGKIEVVPDMAEFSIQLECLEKTVLASKKCLVEKSHDLLKKLKKMKIKEADILTTAVTLNKSHRYEDGKRIFEGYRSTTSLIVTVRNLDILDDIYAELLENQNLTIGGLTYKHSQIEALENKAYVKALKNAQALAQALLTELPETQLEIISIGNVQTNTVYPRPNTQSMEMKVAMADGVNLQRNQSVAISNGTITVSTTLFVQFQIN